MTYTPKNPNGLTTSNNSESVVIAVDQMTSKGSQPSLAMPVQDLKDSSRTYITFYTDDISGVTTEALVTMSINNNGSVISGTSYTVPLGKTLRLSAISVTIKSNNTTSYYGKIRVRSSSTVAATSGIIMNINMPRVAGTISAGIGNSQNYNIPDGIEIAAGQQIGISQIMSGTQTSVSVFVTGFLY